MKTLFLSLTLVLAPMARGQEAPASFNDTLRTVLVHPPSAQLRSDVEFLDRVLKINPESISWSTDFQLGLSKVLFDLDREVFDRGSARKAVTLLIDHLRNSLPPELAKKVAVRMLDQQQFRDFRDSVGRMQKVTHEVTQGQAASSFGKFVVNGVGAVVTVPFSLLFSGAAGQVTPTQYYKGYPRESFFYRAFELPARLGQLAFDNLSASHGDTPMTLVIDHIDPRKARTKRICEALLAS